VCAFFGALAAFVARLASDYAGPYWLSVVITLVYGAFILYANVIGWALFIGAFLPDDWVSEWFD